jgi:hypothetical protein
MKKYFLIFTVVFIAMCLAFSGCKSTTTEPCGNTGTLCIENKMDSTILINIVQKRQFVPLQKDFMECFNLEANVAYTISISGSGYSRPDTTLLILPCDNKLMVVKQ